MNDKDKKRRPALLWAAFLLVILGLGVGAWQAMVHPQTPVPTSWNPMEPLRISDPVTALTEWKFARALATNASCLAALNTGAMFDILPDFEESAQCHIRPQVSLISVGETAIAPIKTRCQTALRLAMWDQHGIQPAAQTYLNTAVREITHFSSYNCRVMRTGSGGSTRMSTHATANAIDISGVVLEDGQRLTLLKGWDGPQDQAAFFRAIRESACAWFRVTLGPDYNALHADHFHLQHTGWGLCR